MSSNPSIDLVAAYCGSKGLRFGARTVLVEGTSDTEIFELGAKLERAASGIDLLQGGLVFSAAGFGHDGGVKGVVRELITLRNNGKNVLDPTGRAKYRFVGLFDNDKAGKAGVRDATDIDVSILEYRDVFRLHPKMPVCANVDQLSLKRAFEKANDPYKSISWELEDMISIGLLSSFESEAPSAVIKKFSVSDGSTHWELSAEGKSRLHRYVRQHAKHEDLLQVIATIRAIRSYLLLPSL